MILKDVMDGLAGLITGYDNVYPWPAPSVSVPCAVVGYPETIDFDMVYQRGGDRMVFPVWLIVGKSDSLDARDRLSDALTGVASLKEALDGQQTFGSVRCGRAEVASITVSGIEHVGIKVHAEVLG